MNTYATFRTGFSTRTGVALWGTILLACCATLGWSQQGRPDHDAEQQNAQVGAEKTTAKGDGGMLDFLKKEAAQYAFYIGDDRKTKLSLRPDPVLRWNNPVRGALDGGLFLWTDDGRPQAAGSIYVYTSEVHHEFQSLSRKVLRGERRKGLVWYPSRAGVERKPVPDAAPPAASGPQRLRQMRSLARGFSATIGRMGQVVVEGGRGEQLRLMPSPLYRYQGEDSKLNDGALFVLAQGTNPEVILLVESRRQEGDYQWHYALARMTGRAINVRYKAQLVWTIPLAPGGVGARRDPYVNFAIRRH